MIDWLAFVISLILALSVLEVRGNRYIDLVSDVSEADIGDISIRACLPVEIHSLDE